MDHNEEARYALLAKAVTDPNAKYGVTVELSLSIKLNPGGTVRIGADGGGDEDPVYCSSDYEAMRELTHILELLRQEQRVGTAKRQARARTARRRPFLRPVT